MSSQSPSNNEGSAASSIPPKTSTPTSAFPADEVHVGQIANAFGTDTIPRETIGSGGGGFRDKQRCREIRPVMWIPLKTNLKLQDVRSGHEDELESHRKYPLYPDPIGIQL